jgi:aminopeptidase N
MTNSPQKIELKDYQAPDFQIPLTKLEFSLHEDQALVTSVLTIETLKSGVPLVLNGEDLRLVSASLDGQPLLPKDFTQSTNQFSLHQPPQGRFQLELTVAIHPEKNTSLEGLYRSGGLFCTQCEPESFRKITYYLDRPDVMSTFTVGIEADASKYPVLLSNGDLIREEKRGDRHWQQFHDPHKKPCYLFALVAGDLECLQDSFTTRSGRNVSLEIYARPGLLGRCEFAMNALKKSMRWDEQRFGREYDLSAFRILSVDDFNAGAMENKGLNIFNSRLILADTESATDEDFYNIESVIAHEYFHNWTGNRVTLRDWFHLSLKEGLTVFRDQEFSADQTSLAEERILSVKTLKERQFLEDAGPNSHPIRPTSCFAVDNFFTATIYEKGAEVIRMMQTLVGRPGFRKGMDLYFERHDGQAVIIEDFARAIADANNKGKDWEQFNLWYSQAGTPLVTFKEEYDPKAQTLKVTVTQDIVNGKLEHPLHIPIRLGQLCKTGSGWEEKPLELVQGAEQFSVNTEGQWLLNLRALAQEFMLKVDTTAPVLSLNRHFSAPIQLKWEDSVEKLVTLLKYDSDPYNRFEAGQSLALQALIEFVRSSIQGKALTWNPILTQSWSSVLASDLPAGLVAMTLRMPDDSIVIQAMDEIHAPALLAAKNFFQAQIGLGLEPEWRKLYDKLKNADTAGERKLKNLALHYLQFCPSESEKPRQSLAWKQFESAALMTDAQSALKSMPLGVRTEALDVFFRKWKHDSLTLNKWFGIQASYSEAGTFDVVRKLVEHPDYNPKNPNCVYALLRTFGSNWVSFHHPINRSYEFFGEQIQSLDLINPSVATRLASAFDVWTRLPESNRNRAQKVMESLISKGLSKNTYEIISKSLTGRAKA